MKQTVEDQLLKAKPGTLILERFYSPSLAEWVPATGRMTGLFLKETGAVVKSLGEHPFVSINSGLIRMDNVFLIPVLMGIHDNLYECWINAKESEGVCKRMLADLSEQSVIPIFFYTKKGRKRCIAVNNTLRDDIGAIAEFVNEAPDWSDDEFMAAKAKVYTEHPTPFALVEALRQAET